ncbi:MAG: PAS domain S-box protein, partial [Deltaproteobacteria bacterium]|nr:PAS domain S-box protein [Deltaproteobacteria bacterium]
MKQTTNKAGYFRRFQTFIIDRMDPPSAVDRDTLLYWRARILFAILFVGLLLGILVFIPVTALVIKEGLWGLGIIDGAAWVILLGLLLCRLRYEIRAAITLLLAYAVGVAVILSVGPLSGGPAWLFAFAVLTGVLLGSKNAIVALAINAITLTIIAWLITTGRFGQTFPFFNTSEAMIVAGANFMFLNAVTAISVTVLVKGLVLIHQKERGLSRTLEIERSQLMEAKERLELEVKERKQAEETLRVSEEKYRLLVENANDSIFIAQDGVFKFANPKTEELTGYSAEELSKIPFVNLIHPDDREMVMERHKRRLEGEDFVSSYSFRAINKTGEEVWNHLNTVPITWEGTPATLNFVRDITEAKRLEDQFEQAQKMEAIA